MLANAPWFKLSSEYFPITVHKTVDLDPTKNYLMGYHPHGIIVIGALHLLTARLSSFKRLFPGLRIRLCMLPIWFKIAFYRVVLD